MQRNTQVLIAPYDEVYYHKVFTLISTSGFDIHTVELPPIAVVALDGAKVVGYIGAHIKYGTTAHIDIMVVEESLRSQNIGKTMGTYLMSMLVGRGATAFTAHVNSTNTAARALYDALGLEEQEEDYKELRGNCMEVLENTIRLRNERTSEDSCSP